MAAYCHRLRWRYIRARRCSHCGVGAALDELLHHTTTTWSTSVRRRSYFCLYLYYYTHYAALGCATCMNAAAAVCLSTTSSICAYMNTSFKMPTSPVSRCATYDLAVDGAVRGACERCTLDLSHQLITRGKLPPDRARRGHVALLVILASHRPRELRRRREAAVALACIVDHVNWPISRIGQDWALCRRWLWTRRPACKLDAHLQPHARTLFTYHLHYQIRLRMKDSEQQQLDARGFTPVGHTLYCARRCRMVTASGQYSLMCLPRAHGRTHDRRHFGGG